MSSLRLWADGTNSLAVATYEEGHVAKTMRRGRSNLATVPAGASDIAMPPVDASDTAIARRAFELYCARGCQDGHDLEDWLYAERELRGQTASGAA
jgi:hypothetical protein